MVDKEFSHEQAKRPAPDGTPHTSSTFNHFIPSYCALVHLVCLALITRWDGPAAGQGRCDGNPSHPNCISVCNIFFLFLWWNSPGYVFDQHLWNQVQPVDTPRQHKCLRAAICRLTTRHILPFVLCSWKTKKIVRWKRKLPVTLSMEAYVDIEFFIYFFWCGTDQNLLWFPQSLTATASLTFNCVSINWGDQDRFLHVCFFFFLFA